FKRRETGSEGDFREQAGVGRAVADLDGNADRFRHLPAAFDPVVYGRETVEHAPTVFFAFLESAFRLLVAVKPRVTVNRRRQKLGSRGGEISQKGDLPVDRRHPRPRL